jgi:hypothetical protein
LTLYCIEKFISFLFDIYSPINFLRQNVMSVEKSELKYYYGKSLKINIKRNILSI